MRWYTEYKKEIKKINSIKTALTRKRQMKVKQTDRLSQQTNYITAK